MPKSERSTWLWTPDGLLGLRLCLISVTILGIIPGWKSIIHFFLQRCPSLNLWSSTSSFPESLLFPLPSFCTYCSHRLEFCWLKGNQIHSSRLFPKAPSSYWPKQKFSQPVFIPYWSLSTLSLVVCIYISICPTTSWASQWRDHILYNRVSSTVLSRLSFVHCKHPLYGKGINMDQILSFRSSREGRQLLEDKLLQYGQ